MCRNRIKLLADYNKWWRAINWMCECRKRQQMKRSTIIRHFSHCVCTYIYLCVWLWLWLCQWVCDCCYVIKPQIIVWAKRKRKYLSIKYNNTKYISKYNAVKIVFNQSRKVKVQTMCEFTDPQKRSRRHTLAPSVATVRSIDNAHTHTHTHARDIKTHMLRSGIETCQVKEWKKIKPMEN